jgi:hypothetical protein
LAHSLSTVQRKNLGTSHTKNRPKRRLLRSPLGAIHGFGVPGLPAPPSASAPEREEVDDLAVAIVGREAERQLAPAKSLTRLRLPSAAASWSAVRCDVLGFPPPL